MLAFVFPGQGSQFSGMGKDLYDQFHLIRETMNEAEQLLGFPLSKICFEGPDSELRKTAHAQPAILALSVGILREVQEATGVIPDLVAGHSLGEYSALVCARAISFVDALRAVQLRGMLMQNVIPAGTGTMAAIVDLGEQQTEQICLEAAHNQVVSIANLNTPKQFVISGHAEAVARAVDLAMQLGGRGIPLNVSGPFHSELMRPAADGMRDMLARVRFSTPRMPVICNVTAAPVVSSDCLADLLVQQITSRVDWLGTINRMQELGVTEILEIGPGRILCGLIEKTAPSIQLSSIGNFDEVLKCYGTLMAAVRRDLLRAGWLDLGEQLVSADGNQIRSLFRENDAAPK